MGTDTHLLIHKFQVSSLLTTQFTLEVMERLTGIEPA